jgi:hypothetical protein
VACAVPTLIQEAGSRARPVEDKRAELAATPHDVVLDPVEVDAIRAIGDNTGCMALKGGTPQYEGPPAADRWPMDPQLEAVAQRWRIDPTRQLTRLLQ